MHRNSTSCNNVHKCLFGYISLRYMVIYRTIIYTYMYVYITDDLHKWLHYNYMRGGQLLQLVNLIHKINNRSILISIERQTYF